MADSKLQVQVQVMDTTPAPQPMLTAAQVAEHCTRQSCWVIVAGQVYDLTDFVDLHPGGANIILRYAGKDATKVYEPIHPAGTIEKQLSASKHLGPVDPRSFSVSPAAFAAAVVPTAKEQQASDNEAALETEPLVPPIAFCQSLHDLEKAAEKNMSRSAWAFVHSAADSLQSDIRNKQDWAKVTFRPRVLRDVARVRTTRNIMGVNSSLPFYISPTGRARVGHPDGELCLAKAAAAWDIPYCVSTAASVGFDDIAACMRSNGKPSNLIYQLFVPKDKQKALDRIAVAKSLGYRGVVLSVDTPVVGKKEEAELEQVQSAYETGGESAITTGPCMPLPKEGPVPRAAHTSSLVWEDLQWIKGAWPEAPLILKGIQTAEDAKLAADAGVDGIILSNQGGRQLDHAPSSLRTLLEIRQFFPEVLEKIDVYLDGGIRRGSDVIKALALGATAVGLGRPFMYGLGAYGTEGVMKAISILSDEIETTMRLLGVNDVAKIDEDYINTTVITREIREKTRREPKLKIKCRL